MMKRVEAHFATANYKINEVKLFQIEDCYFDLEAESAVVALCKLDPLFLWCQVVREEEQT